MVSELCLGTVSFGILAESTPTGQHAQNTLNQMLKNAFDAGINFIDTANIYSDGLTESMIGLALKENGLKRDDLVIATKVGGRTASGPNNGGHTRKHILAQADETLRRLNTGYIDLYQVNGTDAETPFEETLSALDSLVQSGKVRYIGCGNHPAWKVMKAIGISEKNGYQRFQALQAFYTIASRDLEREMIPMLNDQKMGLLVLSPAEEGFLNGKYYRKDTKGGNAARRIFKERAFDVVDIMEPIAESKGITVAQVAMAWLLHQPVVTSVIVEAPKMEQLESHLKSVNVQLTPEELKKLDEITALPVEKPGWVTEAQVAERMPV